MSDNLSIGAASQSGRRADEMRGGSIFKVAVSRSLYKTCTRLAATLGFLGLFGTGVQAAPVTAPIDGEIQSLTLNNPTDHWSGGTMVVGGQNIIIPRNLLMDLPANRLTLKQLFEQAPAACVSLGQSGLAKGDSCNTSGAGAMVNVAANRTNGGNTIAGDVFIQKGIEAVTGVITYINYNEGYFRLNGNVGDASTGIMVRLNDPGARHTIQSGTGCAAGSSNCSADPRFTLDPDNYTSVFVTGFPLCIPSTVARPFPGLASAPVMAAAASTQAAADGAGDLLCPVSNRTISGGQPVDDSRRMAPIMMGDSITAEGNFETVNGVHFLSSHTTKNAMALTTKQVAGQPDYIFPDEVFVDAPGFQNQRIRSLFIGFSTVAPADVVIWSIHYDPIANARHEFPLASTTGCDIAAGASSCTGQGLIPGGGDIFRIRHDVDFLTGAKARLNPCAHLRADPRLAGLNICPTGGSADGNITEMMGILSPLPHEIQARTGRKLVDPTLKTLDVSGNDATNGQYLFPFGIGLGGIDIPNFFEIDLARTDTPFLFSGIPWNLDRRLSPGGCNGSCESTPQPLDPFPFEGLDPRLQAPGLPNGPYGDPNFTASQLSNTRNRILSFVDVSVNRASNGFVAPAAGNFNGNSSLLAWPPVDPAPISIVPTPNVDLVFTVAQGGTNQNPVAVNDAATTAFQTAVVISVLANDSDPDHDVLSVSGVGQGAHGTVSTNGITVRYTPAAGYAGPDSFTYTVSDGRGGSASANVNVTVNAPQNFAPVANPDAASVAVGSTVTIAVLANDTDANGDALTLTAVTQGSRGTATIVGNSVRYTANVGPAGVDSFTYTISDGHGGTATGTVSVTVTAAESLAVASAQFRTGKTEWRINGTSSAEGATVTVRLGSSTGPVIGSAAVAAGAWSVRVAGSPIVPTAGSTISVVSTRGATQSFPVTIRN